MYSVGILGYSLTFAEYGAQHARILVYSCVFLCVLDVFFRIRSVLGNV